MTQNASNFCLFKNISPLQIIPLIIIKIYAENWNVTPNILIKLTKLVENKQSTTENNELQIISDLRELCDYLDDDDFSGQLIDVVWNISSLEELDEMLNSVKKLVVMKQPTTPSTTKQFLNNSLFGIFILQVITYFEMLDYHASLCLYQSLVEFRKSTRDIIETEPSEKSLEDVLNNQLIKLGLNNQIVTSRSKNDLEQLINKQISILEQFGTPTPPYIRQTMKIMTSPVIVGSTQSMSFNNIPSYSYLRYLESLSKSNYIESIDYLHQYFDYMVSNNSKYFYHFALISKASLHQYFGEDQKAINTIEEAISVARENKDNSTLTYILSWFYNFMHNKPHLWKQQTLFNKSNEDQLLDFLIKKSSSINISLYAINLGFETLQMMNNGQSINVYTGNMIKTLFTAINDMKPTFIRSCEMASTVWDRVGVAPMSDLYNELAIEYSENSLDSIRLKAKTLYQEFLKGDLTVNISGLSSETMDHSLYNDIQIRSLIVKIQSYLIQGQDRKAREIMDLLLDSEIKDLELKNNVLFLDIDIDIKVGNYSKALDKISTFEHCNNYLTIKLSILKCKIFDLSKNPHRALSLLTQCIQLSRKYGYKQLEIESTLLYFDTLQDSNLNDEILKLTDDIFPSVYNSEIQHFIDKISSFAMTE
ncbi:uncharacterized protein KGF55_001340 [Candida pseudojiufengensis]|uniref:uncharacterized protein n=1 Tax=Candida pseudojiufengensis TaxID=497109 RepID=UPI0022247C32|nr:uncharacterized protein KGF55_001340 [Candida pseudojiufengensis]KAI5965976.1 hypothetical protein KGF55_001340 [Candida pseudojiufengensis]